MTPQQVIQPINPDPKHVPQYVILAIRLAQLGLPFYYVDFSNR